MDSLGERGTGSAGGKNGNSFIAMNNTQQPVTSNQRSKEEGEK